MICSDINPYAVKLVKQNYSENKSVLKGLIDVRYGDLFSVIKKNENFDVIIFNPPYLPIEKNDIIDKNDWINLAIDGGIDGLNLTKRYIIKVNKYLRKKGRAYFVFSSLSNRDKLDKYINKTDLKAQIVLSRQYNDEKIDVYCMTLIN